MSSAASTTNGLGDDFRAARDRAFRTAKRHTIMVRALRLVLPVAAVALLASYSLFVRQSYRVETAKGGEITFGSIGFSTEALKAYDPRYTGFNSDGGRYEVTAKTAEQDFRQTGPIKLETIDGKLYETNNQVTRLKAVRGDFFDKQGRLELFERIDVDGDNGLKAKLSRATVLTKESRITSDEPVVVDLPGTNVRGRRMTIEQKKRLVVFLDGVETRLTQEQKQPRAARTDAAGFGTGDGPIDIVSRQLTVDDLGKTAVFEGDVVAKQGAATLATPELEVLYEDNSAAKAAGGAAPDVGAATAAPAGSGASRVKLIRAKRDVVMVNGAQRATGSSADFDQRQDIVKLFGPVVITQEPDRKATGDEALVDNKADTMMLTGAVVVTQAKNVLRGRRLFVNRKAQTMQMTAPADGSGAAGRVYARLYSADADRPAAQPAPKKAPAVSSVNKDGNPLATVRRDDPIDIDAATLDVDDKVKTAIFRGNVVAVQGDYTVRAPELVAFYTGDSAFAVGGTPGATAAAGDRKPASELRKVEARQKVLITTKDGRTATANAAEFDPRTNQALLTGDVVLTQDKTVTNGNKATMDMTTGQFRMVDEVAGPSGTPGRVRVLFYPDQVKEAARGKTGSVKKSPEAPAAAPAPTPRPKSSSGWSSDRAGPLDRN